MSDHLTRKELTQDNVALKVGETFDFFTTHRRQAIQTGGAAIAVAVVVWAGFYYNNYTRGVRQQLLAEAQQTTGAPVGSPPPNGGLSFPTDAAKKDGIVKAYAKLTTEHSGSTEGYLAEFALANMDAEAGKYADARKKLQDVADHAGTAYASVARLSLAQLDFAENKIPEAQTILKDLMDHPTELVSKNQASFALAKGLSASQPAEARKLLLGLASQSSDISQSAVSALQDLPQ